MRNICRLAAMAAMLILSASCIRNVKTDLETYGLCCKVREMSVTITESELDYTLFFNRRGQLDSIYRYDPDGAFREAEYYTYGSDHKLQEVRIFDADHEQEGRYEYTFDGDFIRTCTFFGMNNEDLYRFENINDGENIIESSFYYEGELQSTSTKVYDGLTYEETTLDASGECIGTAKCRLFAKDKPAVVDGDETHLEIDYNDKGLPVHTIDVAVSTNGELGWAPDMDDNHERWYRYEYDDRGNWIVRTEHIAPDGPAIITARRTIIY